MCMVYKGVPYSYAFTFKIPDEDYIDREFNVVISNYREDSKDFSGLCLENELRVISEEKMLFAAFFDIVNRIIKITTEGEKEFFKEQGKKPVPLMSVNDQNFLKKFDKYKQSKRSLEYYERLRIWFETPKDSRERNSLKPTEPDIFFCQSVINFYYLTQQHKTPIKEVGFFTI
ncbi:hypothetical protein R84B8_01995 [Treponema sp. R8-4-B8]